MEFPRDNSDVPFDGNVQTPRKLSHFRKAGAGDPMWSGACIYGLSGQSPSISEYDSPDPYGASMDDGLNYHVRGGVVTTKSLRDAEEPTITRETRTSAHFDSAPAARVFQGFANVRWSGIFQGMNLHPRVQINARNRGRAALPQSNNPNAWGSKELHPATQYKPFPPMGSIVPAYGEMKAL